MIELIDHPVEATGQKNFVQVENRGEPLEKNWSPGVVRPPVPSRAPAHWDLQFGQQGLPVPMPDYNGEVGHTPRPTPTPYPPRPPPLLLPSTQGVPPGGWVPPLGGGQPVRPPLATGLAALGLLDSSLQAFVVDLQGMVAAGVSAAVPSPAPSAPTGKVATLSLLYLCFACCCQWMGTSLQFVRRSPE